MFSFQNLQQDEEQCVSLVTCAYDIQKFHNRACHIAHMKTVLQCPSSDQYSEKHYPRLGQTLLIAPFKNA
jgi:hypothetical protein